MGTSKWAVQSVLNDLAVLEDFTTVVIDEMKMWNTKLGNVSLKIQDCDVVLLQALAGICTV